MKALTGVRVTVYERDTANTVKIYQNHDGTTQGPSAESGATGGPNPFLTGPGGMVEFWCDGPDELDIKIEDTIAPARVATRTIGWNCVTAAAGSIPTSMLAGDAALDLDALSDEIKRQLVQIGEVIDWWRPQSSVPIPAGFEVCDGHQVPAGQHDFPGLATSAINLPDLRNCFILGADSGKADSTGATAVDTAAGAPGIRGSGGSQTHVTVTAELPAHHHEAGALGAVAAGSHTHGHGLVTSAASHVTGAYPWALIANGSVVTGKRDGTGSESFPVGAGGGGTASIFTYNSGAHSHTISGAISAAAAHTHDVSGDTADTGGGTAHNNTPRFVGLLKLMKVRRS